jgi:hypothetical protein
MTRLTKCISVGTREIGRAGDSSRRRLLRATRDSPFAFLFLPFAPSLSLSLSLACQYLANVTYDRADRSQPTAESKRRFPYPPAHVCLLLQTDVRPDLSAPIAPTNQKLEPVLSALVTMTIYLAEKPVSAHLVPHDCLRCAPLKRAVRHRPYP